MLETAANATPPGLQRVRLADCPPQPWRNGGGLTHELLAWAGPAGDAATLPGSTPPAWTVRVSVAEIARDGPFSPYPGVDRAFAVLEGRGVVLAWPRGDTVCRPGDEALRFDGADAPGCRLVDGPTLDLNLMAQARAGRAAMKRALPGSPRAATARGNYPALRPWWPSCVASLCRRWLAAPGQMLWPRCLGWRGYWPTGSHRRAGERPARKMNGEKLGSSTPCGKGPTAIFFVPPDGAEGPLGPKLPHVPSPCCSRPLLGPYS